jgi:hypothetical protein
MALASLNDVRFFAPFMEALRATGCDVAPAGHNRCRVTMAPDIDIEQTVMELTFFATAWSQEHRGLEIAIEPS